MERTLGSSNDGATESVEDFNENGENIELDLSLGDIPNVDWIPFDNRTQSQFASVWGFVGLGSQLIYYSRTDC